jgi:hypothetical protein
VCRFELVKMPAGWTGQPQIQFSNPQECAPVHFDAAREIVMRHRTSKHQGAGFQVFAAKCLASKWPASKSPAPRCCFNPPLPIGNGRRRDLALARSRTRPMTTPSRPDQAVGFSTMDSSGAFPGQLSRRVRWYPTPFKTLAATRGIPAIYVLPLPPLDSQPLVNIVVPVWNTFWPSAMSRLASSADISIRRLAQS